MSLLKIDLFFKTWCLKSSLLMTRDTQRTTHTVRWPCKPIILSIGHSVGPIETEVNSCWEVPSLWLTSRLKIQANFLKNNELFCYPFYGNLFVSKKLPLKESFADACDTQTVRWPCEPITINNNTLNSVVTMQLHTAKTILLQRNLKQED